ncbi:MAG: potassium-transporting ATPase subunit KdpA [Luteibacter sp.]|uniref:potassium-transporting ATPase subunit KdpA n=1 Tax=unclassified Luteibacter TaxID=2620188 RepID=UPI0005B941C5|nr:MULTISPECIES: potassium-transporting ATPase subunit KdpA [unclassified Luteibacter]MDQ7995677.1 potassium-transporting ATPase subunit KdpA [Luteibacter sp.]MDQ8047765.1 potassium-transporting ATPase subunit KdpA [Luteibacter sp.]MDR6644415.1 K+-transporting ATPase ATPase A chain [Luteibacter sp. 1214]
MSANDIFQIGLFLAILLVLVKPVGQYMALVFADEPNKVTRFGGRIERVLYRVSGIRAGEDMSWTRYAIAMLAFNVAGLAVVYLLQRAQAWLPLNPQHFGAVSPDSAMNTAISFATNTNWQGYAGESTMSYLTQALGLAVQNFLSAATGIAVLIAVIRGFSRRGASAVGNFWVDMTRATLYVLVPFSLVIALLLVSQGVVQNLAPYLDVATVQQGTQTLPMGPAASQIAIKMLGTNGGGFFNANSAHPFENPTPFSNFVEMLSIFLIPAALCYTFGSMVGDRRQGWAILATMLLIFVPLTVGLVAAEQAGNPALHGLAIDAQASGLQAGGNMEGKETRFGIAASGLFAAITTAASCGAVNTMHDSLTPLGGLVPMWLMQLGEVIFGGVGSGLYGMLAFAVVAVFIAGLMVGRTPEYLGKKIEAHEMKMASLAVLLPCALVVIGTAIAVMSKAGVAGVSNPGAHGFSEMLYAVSSAANNNGSAFGGLSANTPFWNVLLGICMFLSRFPLAIAMLAMAGSLAAKKHVPESAGTLPTHTPLFITLLACIVIVVGALTFLPALALGPIAEQLMSATGH